MNLVGIISKALMIIVTVAIIIAVFVTINNTALEYDCYQTQCVEYNIYKFKSCTHLGIESTGFLSSEDFYFCDGAKIAKRCSKVEEVKRDIEPTLLGVIFRECTTLKEKIELNSSERELKGGEK